MSVEQVKILFISGVNLTFFNLKSIHQSTLIILTLNTKILQASHVLNKIENIHKVNHLLLITRNYKLKRILVKPSAFVVIGIFFL